MEIKIKRISDLAKIPMHGSDAAAGYDLYAAVDFPLWVHPHETVKVPTGLTMEIPEGYWGGIYARSGLATKVGLRPANCTGLIDSDYRGEIIVALHNDTENPQVINAGERIAQFVLMPQYNIDFKETDNLTNTDRGEGGFGSTGTN